MLALIQHKGKLGAMGYYEFDYRGTHQTTLLRMTLVGLHGF